MKTARYTGDGTDRVRRDDGGRSQKGSKKKSAEYRQSAVSVGRLADADHIVVCTWKWEVRQFSVR